VRVLCYVQRPPLDQETRDTVDTYPTYGCYHVTTRRQPHDQRVSFFIGISVFSTLDEMTVEFWGILVESVGLTNAVADEDMTIFLVIC
jgi:hypothetical protein